MNTKKYLISGIFTFLIGLAALISGALLQAKLSGKAGKFGFFFLFMFYIVCLYFSRRLFMKSRGKSYMKAYEAENHDERSHAIEGKAAHITLQVMVVLYYLFSAYLVIRVSPAAGYLCVGFLLVGILLYTILCAVIGSRM